MSHRVKTLLVTSVATLLFITGCGNDNTEPASLHTETVQLPGTTVTATATVTVSPTESHEALLTLVEGDVPGNGRFVVCDDGHSGIATDVTSCPFAINVRRAYMNQDRPYAVVYVYSPVTKKDYDMQCQPGFTAVNKSGQRSDAVRCVGGNNAVVVIF